MQNQPEPSGQATIDFYLHDPTFAETGIPFDTLAQIRQQHKAIRRLITVSMSSARLARLEPGLRAVCGRMVDAMIAAPVANLHDDYAMAILVQDPVLWQTLSGERGIIDHFVEESLRRGRAGAAHHAAMHARHCLCRGRDAPGRSG